MLPNSRLQRTARPVPLVGLSSTSTLLAPCLGARAAAEPPSVMRPSTFVQRTAAGLFATAGVLTWGGIGALWLGHDAWPLAFFAVLATAVSSWALAPRLFAEPLPSTGSAVIDGMGTGVNVLIASYVLGSLGYAVYHTLSNEPSSVGGGVLFVLLFWLLSLSPGLLQFMLWSVPGYVLAGYLTRRIVDA